MWEYNVNWPAELKAAEQLRYRAECKVRCLTSALDRVDPTGFDALMNQIEAAQMELQAAGEAKFACFCRWFDTKKMIKDGG